MIVQIYEIQTPQEAEKCIELGVDHIGSIVLDKDAWKDPVLRETVRICRGAGKKSSLNPLFYHLETTCRVLDFYEPDFIHFCDTLTDDRGVPLDLSGFVALQQALKEKFPEIHIIRSLPIHREGAATKIPCLEIARELEPFSDLFLTDTSLGKEPVEGFIGITGKTVDWAVARSLVLQSRIPVILAGGLSPQNVHQALTRVRPAGADSCTRTNRVDAGGTPIRFQKDFGLVERFVQEARRAEREIREEKEALLARLDTLRANLEDREKALPAHSVRPHQIMIIEELEEEIESVEKELSGFPPF